MTPETVFRGNLAHAMANDVRLCPLVRSQLYGMAVRMKLGLASREPVAKRSAAVNQRLAQLRDAELAQRQQRQRDGKFGQWRATHE